MSQSSRCIAANILPCSPLHALVAVKSERPALPLARKVQRNSYRAIQCNDGSDLVVTWTLQPELSEI